MTPSISRTSALALAAAFAASASIAAAQAKDDPGITALTLFTLQLSVENSVVPIEQDAVIPYRVGDTCYGWFLEFEPVDGIVVLEEVLSLPAPAEQWGLGSRSAVADDRQSARTALQFNGLEGTAEHSWCVLEGDPEGSYSFTLSREGEALGQLRFRLERQ